MIFLFPSDTTRFQGQAVRRARFAMSCPVDLYDRLVRNDNLKRTLGDVVGITNEQGWQETSDEAEATLTTPLGFTLRLTYQPR
jgi:hypothetical protein